MPYKRKRTTKRRPRRRRQYRRRARVSRGVSGFASGMPKTHVARLRYSQVIPLNSTFGTISNHRFRINSLYDPDYDTTGHQPMGYDTWSSLYNHYVVTGAKISIKSLSASGSALHNDPAAYGIYFSDDTSVPYTDFTGFVEAKRGTYGTVTGQRNTVSRTAKWSARRYFDVKDVKDNMLRIGAPISNSPNELCMANIWWQCLDSSQATSEQDFVITIDFVARFSEPKDLAQS